MKRVAQILDLLAEQGMMSSREIIGRLCLPKSSTYLLLNAMKRYGLLRQDKSGAFSLGIKLIALGDRAAVQLDLREVARMHLTRLMEEVGLLCHFGIMDGDSAYYILKIESRGAISVRSYIGKTLSLYSSGIGKCLLAWQPEDARRSIIANTRFVAATPTTITSPQALEQELAAIRERGWSFDNGEDVPDVRCVAAPVFDATGEVVAAISVVGAAMQIEGERLGVLPRQVLSCARAISCELGWRNGLPDAG